MVIEINTDNFENEVLKADKTALVDLWAGWCGPCRMLAPIIDEIANEYPDKYKICKINVDEQQALAMKFNVQSIPTLLIFKDGREVEKLVGLRPKEEIIAALERT